MGRVRQLLRRWAPVPAVALAWAMLVPAVCDAQPRYLFEAWTTGHGLPHNSINSIVQSPDGYLWLATHDGLARFDGVRFVVFDRSTSPGIRSNRFVRLFIDDDGTLWAITDEGWLTRRTAGDVFTTYTSSEGLPGAIYTLSRGGTGGLRVVSSEGVAEWDGHGFVRHTCPGGGAVPADATFHGGNTIAWSSANRLHLFTGGCWTSHAIPAALGHDRLLSSYEATDGGLWFSTGGSGLARFGRGVWTFFPTGLRPGAGSPIAHEDHLGNLWFLQRGGGLRHLRGGAVTAYDDLTGLTEATVRTFYEDRERNLWIGTSRGLYRAREASFSVLSHRDGLAANEVYPVLEDRSGALWIGTWGAGLDRYEQGTFTHYALQDGLRSVWITALHEDRDGRIWIGTTGGLHRFEHGRIVPVEAGRSLSGEIWVIHQSPGGTFWFGTSEGLVRHDAGVYTRYTTADGLAGNDVKAIVDSGAGGVWIGTWAGLSRFADGHFTSYREADGLPSDHVRALYEGSDGVLWIGTYDGGLGRLARRQFTRYSIQQGLHSNGVFQILPDDRGHLWFSSNTGVYRVSLDHLNGVAAGALHRVVSISYGTKDGLLSAECNGGRQPSGWKGRDGRLWFPTMGGVAVVNPAAIHAAPPRIAPGVVVEESSVAGRTVAAGAPVVVQPGGAVEIRYAGLSLARPEGLRFKYRLEGLDRAWTEAGSRRTAYFSHLPPGTYTFRVLVSHEDAPWNEPGASVRVVVIPTLWQTTWFRGSAAAGLTIAGVLAYRRRMGGLRRAQTVREAYSRQLIVAQEQDRKRVAHDLHATVVPAVSFIQRYALDGLDGPEDPGGQLARFAKIAAAARDAADDTHRIAYNLRPPEIDRLPLNLALSAIIRRYQEVSAIRFTLDVTAGEACLEPDEKVHLCRIVQECLGNVVRHSRASACRVTVADDEAHLRIAIEDDGVGFESDAVRARSAGLGLRGIIERAHVLGARADIRSAPGQGARITIRIGRPPRQP